MTKRRIQVLQLYANGLQAKQVAAQLGISTYTALIHIREVRKQLQAQTTAHAVAIALRKGLIQ